MATRRASAEWTGGMPAGSGKVGSASGALEGDYSFASRMEEGAGTNPEELLGAAHAGCFSMALSGILTQAGNPPESIRTEASVQFLKQGEGFAITRINLDTVGRVPGIDDAAFQEAAQAAKENCPVSKALASVPEMNVSARLEG